MLAFPDGLFIYEEYLRALRLVAPEAEADELARGLSEPMPELPAPMRDPEPVQPGEQRWVTHPVRGRLISEDTLVLLSLVSEDLERRVQQLRDRIREENRRLASSPPDEAEEDARWHSRRSEFRDALVRTGRLTQGER